MTPQDRIPAIVRYMYRHPKTANERRKYFRDKEEVKVRPKRSPKYLPDDWDDLCPGKKSKPKGKNKADKRRKGKSKRDYFGDEPNV